MIIGGAGGVSSIAIQLAKQVAGLTVIATASRPETVTWSMKMGADYTINHRKKFTAELEKLDLQQVDYILCLNDTDGHWQNMLDVIKPWLTDKTRERLIHPLRRLRLRSAYDTRKPVD